MPKHTKYTEDKKITLEQIYNLLMGSVEPELTTDVLPHLVDLYANETAEDNKKRMERYEWAFTEFDRKFESFMALWKDYISQFQKDVLEEFKSVAIKQEIQELSDIEHSIDTEK